MSTPNQIIPGQSSKIRQMKEHPGIVPTTAQSSSSSSWNNSFLPPQPSHPPGPSIPTMPSVPWQSGYSLYPPPQPQSQPPIYHYQHTFPAPPSMYDNSNVSFSTPQTSITHSYASAAMATSDGDASLPPWRIPKGPTSGSLSSTTGLSFSLKTPQIAIKSNAIPIVKPPPLPPGPPPPPHSTAGIGNIPTKSTSTTTAVAATVTASSSTTGQWPPSLRSYVDRCFSACRVDEDRDRMEAFLKEKIQNAIRKGIMHSMDWNGETLPINLLTPVKTTFVSTAMEIDNINLSTESKKNGANLAEIKTKATLSTKNEVKKKGTKTHIPEIATSLSRKSQSLSKAIQSNNNALSPPNTQALSPLSSSTQSSVFDRNDARARRFQEDQQYYLSTKAASLESSKITRRKALLAMAEEGIDWDECTIIGTNEALEKPYLRLTSAPDPRTVRPLPILKKSLVHLQSKWQQALSAKANLESSLQSSYAFICDQLKSLRQDLTVQRIRNEFTIQVYEWHARLAMEMGDLGEYNQCQGQLKILYEEHHQQQLEQQSGENCHLSSIPLYTLVAGEGEFTAYRILYLLHTQNKAEMNTLLKELTPVQCNHPSIQHALQVQSAMSRGNYHHLFQLCKPDKVPGGGYHLIKWWIGRERKRALLVMCKAYRPHLEIFFIARELGFIDQGHKNEKDSCTNETKGIYACKEFLKENNAVITFVSSVVEEGLRTEESNRQVIVIDTKATVALL